MISVSNASASVIANELLPVPVAPKITISFSCGESCKCNDFTESNIFVKHNGSASKLLTIFFMRKILTAIHEMRKAFDCPIIIDLTKTFGG